ncbi:hypothetical protein PPERSA_04524 [Pseudocohnilembus persalinus]|uniref:Uncharacterized protein n=1 Tax=Pseudocohnilembus persalinus TaxID=266149 RepID=A0A0V0QT33_PSEPJ|nr:hypothetical protein PPERSA_04524 [Pseudocohnilembus persalinus]|eukprot:KRX05487.1 hypothetical protein PPERSA_04524 [Pseudocohnilembus persalinus]
MENWSPQQFKVFLYSIFSKFVQFHYSYSSGLINQSLSIDTSSQYSDLGEFMQRCLSQKIFLPLKYFKVKLQVTTSEKFPRVFKDKLNFYYKTWVLDPLSKESDTRV